ncbi:DUF6538 domain-containing protein [Bradyrhizobium sp. LMG 9283]|uniref:DUF6538 domain-containing protein n=1 Tax=Bradyrhizobium sp. LMG 9283 TaxID=592064 RepID=UPI00388F0C15
MARPAYLHRRPDGRYCIQIRLGKRAQEIYGRSLLRVSLRTANFQEARRRLVVNLGWAVEIVEAPDLEALASIFDRRLKAYVAVGVPGDERELSGRQAFEFQVRHFLARARERGFFYAVLFPGLARNWVDFVDQNKAAEAELLKRTASRLKSPSPAAARLDMAEQIGGLEILPSSPVLAPFDPIALAKDLVTEFAKHLGNSITAPAEKAVHEPDFAAAELDAAVPVASSKRMSDVLVEFLRPEGRKRQHKMKGRSEAEAIIQFAIDLLGDPVMHHVTAEQWKQLDEALTDIPNRDNIPADDSKTLFQRYKYAQTHGWSGLVRLTTKTIKSRYWGGLYKFIDWSIQEKHCSGPRPNFECIDPENLASLPRDAFDDEELLTLIEQPLFTGCRNRTHVWQPGGYLVQSHLYWGFLICILTGMRPGEVGQLKCADIRSDGKFYYFDLRPFDARNGRIAVKDLRNLKTNSAGCVIPIHPLLIELGLLDRMQDLMDGQEERLFPEWEHYTRKDGTIRWSQPLSKAWQYVKAKLKPKLDRADLTLYSTRHLMADWLDNEAIAQRTRDRILGHASDVRGRYGRKGILDPEMAAMIEKLEPPVVKQMREILLAAKGRADAGGLIVLTTY